MLTVVFAGFAADECDAATWAPLAAFGRANGAVRALYLHLPPPGSREAPSMIATGDPDATACYLAERRYRRDARLRAMMRRGAPCVVGSDPGEDPFATLRPAGARAIGAPLFGPSHRNGYLEIGLAEGAPRPDAALLQRAQRIGQTAHLALCARIADAAPPAQALTAREREILEWVARGKANESVATILGLSPHTVDTYLRRIYEKLGVNDRISATLRGLALGEIQILD